MRLGYDRPNSWQDLLAEPDDGIDIRTIIHHPREDDRSRLLGRTGRTEIIEIDAVPDKTDGNSGDQLLEIAFLGRGMDQRMRETVRNISLIGEQTFFFECVEPAQRYP